MNSSFCKCFSALTLAFFVLGCGPGGPPLYKAGGTVTYNGKPVSGANVVFQYEDGMSASGVSDASGKFALTYFGNPKGAAAGKCLVTVSKSAAAVTADVAPADIPKDPQKMMEMMKKMGGADKMNKDAGGPKVPEKPKNELPMKYADFSTSGLSYEITSDESKNNFDIALKD